MTVKIMLGGLLFWWNSVCLAMPASDIQNQASKTVASENIATWGLGLLIVLGIFFICVWGVRKLDGLPAASAEKMRVVGGLSLGMREKVILLQVGKQQLVLGVTPGRIETLHVLEGENCLIKEDAASLTAPANFAQTLLHAIKARTENNRRDPL